MENFDRTVFFAGDAAKPKMADGSILTVFESNQQPKTFNLGSFGKMCVTFGRDPKNDIILSSSLVSGEHGRFVFKNGLWFIEDKVVYTGQPSTNGIIYNNARVRARCVFDGDFIRIDNNQAATMNGVLFVFSASDSQNRWTSVSLLNQPQITIGRDSRCQISLPHVSVSKLHAVIRRENDGFYLYDNKSTNGVIVNNKRVVGKVKLQEKDVIVITNTKLIFTSGAVYYCSYNNGISVVASDVVIVRGKGEKAFVTCNHVNLDIKPGELVAIIGGSGAGKSTILNAMCGYLEPSQGEVFINGVDLYKNFDSLKKLIGYVPQSDIVYDNLTLHDMLMYTAQLRLPDDTTPEEMEAAISRAIATVELTEKKDSFIKALSGGQRKRASIAVELLSDPNLLFLDEPASGLDPGTERNLMQSLRTMANGGKTVILVTHSTLQLKMCDKIVFMGKGGNLAFYGSYDEALNFFGVSDIVDVYNMITDHAGFWKDKYEKMNPPAQRINPVAPSSSKPDKNKFKQLKVISSRYIKLVVNDRQRLLLLLGQAPILALLISFVANGEQFRQYEITKSLLFALSCSAFWVGMLNAIQEICKERSILKREYMTGLSLTSYISSKMIVLGTLCLIQSVLITGVFAITVGMPSSGVINLAFLEIFISTFLTAVSSAAMGLFVSSLFTNADRAMTVAPILILPQILFSGLLFKLSGATEVISWFAVCRWSMEGLGSTANLNALDYKIYEELENHDMLQMMGMKPDDLIEHEAEAFFENSFGHLLGSWALLIGFTILFLALARFVLSKIGKEKS